jgi:DNA/RNA endonuclease YhcR with UshA esterase domain
VAENLALRKGDRILAYGIVQTYRGEKEIVVQEACDIEMIGTTDGH